MDTNSDTSGESSQNLKALIREGQDVLKCGVHLVAEQVHDKLDGALEAAQALREKAERGLKVSDKVIRKHPYESLGIAFGIGMVIGLLLQRR